MLGITPPGGGKTEGIPIQNHDTWVVPEIELAKNIARRKGTASYRQEDGARVRHPDDLALETEAVTGCINSLQRALRLRPDKAQWVFDEVTASLWAVAGPGNLLDKQGPAVLAEMERRFRCGQHVFGLGADITPQLEGVWLAEQMRIPFDVLIKFRQRSAAQVRVLELMCDAELIDLFVRIVLHNRSNPPALRIRVLIHSNTKGLLKRLRALSKIHNPAGILTTIFIDSEAGVPPEFVADPDAEWIKYDVIGLSPKIKSGRLLQGGQPFRCPPLLWHIANHLHPRPRPGPPPPAMQRLALRLSNRPTRRPRRSRSTRLRGRRRRSGATPRIYRCTSHPSPTFRSSAQEPPLRLAA